MIREEWVGLCAVPQNLSWLNYAIALLKSTYLRVVLTKPLRIEYFREKFDWKVIWWKRTVVKVDVTLFFSVISNSVSCCLTVEGRDNDKRRVSRSVCCPNAFLVLWRRFSACFFVKKKEKKSVTSTLTSLRFQQTTFQSNYLLTLCKDQV